MSVSVGVYGEGKENGPCDEMMEELSSPESEAGERRAGASEAMRATRSDAMDDGSEGRGWDGMEWNGRGMGCDGGG